MERLPTLLLLLLILLLFVVVVLLLGVICVRSLQIFSTNFKGSITTRWFQLDSKVFIWILGGRSWQLTDRLSLSIPEAGIRLSHYCSPTSAAAALRPNLILIVK